MTLDITFHPGTYADIDPCLRLDHSCDTDRVWQMTIHQGEPGVIGVMFKQEYLPRPVQLTHAVDKRRLYDDPDAGRLWVVARRYEPEPPAPPPAEVEDNVIMAVPAPRPPVIGYVVARYDESQEVVWVDDVAVTPEYRRLKVATRLLDGVRQWAREQGAHRLLIAIPTKHVPMMALAGQLGLSFCGYNDQYFLNHDIAVIFGLRLARRGRVE